MDYRTGDDAGVYLLDEGRALVQTVDFFTPVVDDPEAFGAIAAANALSDVYAMGGRPLTALSIAAFPEKDFPAEWAAAIVRGGHRKLQEAGCALLGGHTVRDPEIKFGYAVTGLVEPEHMFTNAGGPRGGRADPHQAAGHRDHRHRAQGGPRARGRRRRGLRPGHGHPQPHPGRGGRARRAAGGHRHHGLRPAGARRGGGPPEPPHPRDRRDALPLLPGARGAGARSSSRAASRPTAAQFEPRVDYAGELEPALQAILYDPQTSGGLLLLAPGDIAPAVLQELPHARAIGRAQPPGPRPLRVRG